MARQAVENRMPQKTEIKSIKGGIVIFNTKELIERGSRIYVLGRNGKSLKR